MALSISPCIYYKHLRFVHAKSLRRSSYRFYVAGNCEKQTQHMQRRRSICLNCKPGIFGRQGCSSHCIAADAAFSHSLPGPLCSTGNLPAEENTTARNAAMPLPLHHKSSSAAMLCQKHTVLTYDIQKHV